MELDMIGFNIPRPTRYMHDAQLIRRQVRVCIPDVAESMIEQCQKTTRHDTAIYANYKSSQLGRRTLQSEVVKREMEMLFLNAGLKLDGFHTERQQITI
ncbi:predicted protein [Botrytis cinerea T4]|uniref:Uncharacterized protein n=1 Tax=Botryotinia fuckeliana (strain T4) TaxID=999810 RepID=G2YBT1_BOTF4|nr:predicted protein [Botrytis cinerea T4]